jgi:crossover junction endodeoxyribonuclease RusA
VSGRSWTIEVPGPPLLLNAERKLVPKARAAEVARIRQLVVWLASEARIPRPGKVGPIVVDATPHYPTRRSSDVAACFPSVKAAIDGLVDRGVIPDDGPEWVRRLTFHPPQLGVPGMAGLTLTITEENA